MRSRPPSGRKRKVIYAKSYAEARRKLAEALADRDLGYDAGGFTLGEYLQRGGPSDSPPGPPRR